MTSRIWEKIKHRRTTSAPACLRGTNPCSMPYSAWFFTFMYINIPIVGWIYLPHLAFRRKEDQLRDFAKTYLVYKLVFLTIALVLLRIMV